MKAHPLPHELTATPLRPDVRRHLQDCPRCRVERRRLATLGGPPELEVDPADRYRVGQVLGHGPRSTVHEAFDMLLERNVAYKRLTGPVDHVRLHHVKDALDALAHPHVARILDLPATESGAFTREWIPGKSLHELADAPDPMRHAWFCQLAAALSALHQAGMAHGALHGANVRVSATGQIHLVDAGVGAPLTGAVRAPELGGPLDRSFAADWYAVGTLFESGPLPDLAQRLRAPDPADRPSANDVLSALLLERDPAMEGHGRYRKIKTLGRGGMGEVHQVRDPLLNRLVALKSIRPDLLASEDAHRRFRTEAQITAQLEHPGVIPVHEMGQLADGSTYFTMKQVAGHTLAAVLQGAPSDPTWSLSRGVDILIRASEAVAYAHSRGVVHRDLKPANLMVGDFGEVLVVDWGLAKLVGEGADPIEPDPATPEAHSRPGIGTPGYMPLEQASGGDVGPAADVFALGTILQELLDTAPAAPPALQAVARRAVDREPANRYADAGAFARELTTWRSGGLVDAYDYSWIERIGRRLRPYQAPLLVAAVSTAVVAVVGAGGVYQVSSHQRNARKNLAQSLVERAQLAMLANDRIPAEAYAAQAVALDNRPEARGLLARMHRAPYPSLVFGDSAPCEELAVRGEWAACRRGSQVRGLSATGTPWTAAADRVWPGLSGQFLLEQGNRVRAVDASTGAQVHTWTQDEAIVGTAVLGDKLVLATAQRVQVVGGAADDERLPRVEVVELVPCGPDATLFRTATHALYRWRPGEDAEVLPIRARGTAALACDETGRSVALAMRSEIHVWSLSPEVQTASLMGHEAPVTHLAWSEGHLASASSDGTVRLWASSSGEEHARLPLRGPVGLAFHGDRLWLAGSEGQQLWELPHDVRVPMFDAIVDLQAIDWTLQGHLVTVDDMGDWRRNSPQTGRSDASIPLAGVPPAAIATRADAAQVAVGLPKGHVALIDEEREILWSTEVGPVPVTATAWAPTGERIVAGLADGSLKELSPDGRVRATWTEASDDPVRRLRFSTDGRALAVEHDSGRAVLYRDSQPVRTLEGVTQLAVSGDGGLLVSVHEDGSARASTPTRSMPLPPIGAKALALSPDGALLATASSRLVQVWSTADGTEIARLVAHARGAVDLAFAPDGSALATAGRDGVVHLWDLEPVRADAHAVVSKVEHRYGAISDRLDAHYGGL